MKNYDNEDTVDLLYVEYFPVEGVFKGTFSLASGRSRTKEISAKAVRGALRLTNRLNGDSHNPVCTDRTDWHETSSERSPRFQSIIFYIWGNINSFPEFKGGPELSRRHYRWEPEYTGAWHLV